MNDIDSMRRERELKRIEKHLNKWRAGKKPCTRRTFYSISFVFSSAICLALYLCGLGSGKSALELFVMLFCVSNYIREVKTPGMSDTWQGRISALLDEYTPLNLPAWEHLKHQAETEGLTVNIVSNWYQEEVRTVWPEKKPDLKFLHKVTDGNEKIGEK